MKFEAHHLFKSFGAKSSVQDVSLVICPGEIIGLFGPNGAGKTTCFLMMTGLLKPDRGTIEIAHQDVTCWPLYRKARLGVRYLPQEPSVFRGLTVAQNLLAVLEIIEPLASKRQDQLDRLLTEFRLHQVRDCQALLLSGGERRRVEIARSLIGHPRFLFLDEPLAGIDPRSIEELKDLIRYLAQQGIGILVTDHNVKDMLPLVDRAYIMYEGRLLKEGSPQIIALDPEVKRVYLGESFNL